MKPNNDRPFKGLLLEALLVILAMAVCLGPLFVAMLITRY